MIVTTAMVIVCTRNDSDYGDDLLHLLLPSSTVQAW